jgi:hypothetical protein
MRALDYFRFGRVWVAENTLAYFNYFHFKRMLSFGLLMVVLQIKTISSIILSVN